MAPASSARSSSRKTFFPGIHPSPAYYNCFSPRPTTFPLLNYTFLCAVENAQSANISHFQTSHSRTYSRSNPILTFFQNTIGMSEETIELYGNILHFVRFFSINMIILIISRKVKWKRYLLIYHLFLPFIALVETLRIKGLVKCTLKLKKNLPKCSSLWRLAQTRYVSYCRIMGKICTSVYLC
jgi:hypothetical protein